MAIIAVTKGRSWPKATASRMNGLNFSLFSMNCGAKGVPSCRAPDVLGPVDDDEMAARIDEPRVAGPEPAVGIDDLARGLLVLQVALEDDRRRCTSTSPRSAILTSIPGHGRPAVVGLASVLGWSDTRPVVSVEP